MTYAIEKYNWLDHGAGEVTIDAPEGAVRISNLNNINALSLYLLGPNGQIGEMRSLHLDEFVSALNEIGFTVTAKAQGGPLGQEVTHGPSLEDTHHGLSLGEVLAAEWEDAEVGTAHHGDRVITRTGTFAGGVSYGTFTSTTLYPVSDDRVRILERAPKPEPLPEWLDAKVVRATYKGDSTVLVRDDEDDWLVADGEGQGDYVMRLDVQHELSEVEILVAA